jgi:nucleotide sugar dehydrogenase
MLTSTTYVGTTRELLVEPLARRGLLAGREVAIAFSPERIDPGNIDFPVERTPRVVGGVTETCLQAAAAFLALTAPLVHQVSSCEAAEMAKLHENTFRAVNIAYANEIADVCEELGLDPSEVIDAAATKPYGFMAFRPGPGVGGHCIPCDPHYLLWQLRARRAEAPIIDAAMRAIAARPGSVVRRVLDNLADCGIATAGARVLVLGVAYKPGVGDLRESPALEIIDSLHRAGAVVGFHDPYISSVRLASGVLTGVPEIHADDWDLVLVHTIHPGVSLDGVIGRVPFLDATYSLRTTE